MSKPALKSPTAASPFRVPETNRVFLQNLSERRHERETFSRGDQREGRSGFVLREEPPTPREEPPTPREEPPTPREEPPTPREEPPTPREEPPTPRGEPPTPRGEPPTPREEPPTPREEPPTPRGEPPTPRGEPPTPRGEPPTPRVEPPTPRGEPPTQRGEPPTPREEPPTPREEPPTPREEPPTPRGEPPTQRGEPPTPREEPPTPREEPPTQRGEPPTQRGEEGEEGEEGEWRKGGGRRARRAQEPAERRKAQNKPTAARKELQRVMMKRDNVTRESRHDFMNLERQKAVLELSVMTKRAEIEKMDCAIAKEERALKVLETRIERDNRLFEECLKQHEKKSVEARTFFEQEARSKQQKAIEIKKLTAEIATTESDLEKIEETLVDYKRYKDLLFKLSPVEWQEKQLAKAQNKTDLRKKDESLTQESSSQSDPENSRLGCDVSQYEEDPQLFFTEPQQLQDLLTELTEQNLSLIQNSARVEETLEELRANISSTRQQVEEDEQLLEVQIHNMKQRIQTEKTRGNKLRQKVQLHVSLNTQDQDVLLDALGDKVSQVHQSCVDERISNYSTLEKLTQIESALSQLLQNLESIPEESLEMMRRVKESEKRARQREKTLREQQQKQKERMRRYLERSMSEPKKVLKKKQMPKFVPVVQKVSESKVEETAAEDEIQKYLFPSDESD